jgi:UPF0716 protein FxsA
VRLAKKIAIALLLLPLAELVAFGLVAWAIGLPAALGLMLLTSAAGVLVLRRAGRRSMTGWRAGIRNALGHAATGSAGPLLALGGILLLLPGFITDLAGACLLVGPLRRAFGAAIGRALGRRRPRRGAGAVIDLTPDEWRPVPDPAPRPRDRS